MPIEIPSNYDNMILFTAVVAFFAPILLDLILQSRWRAWVQSVIAFVVSAVIGTTGAALSGAFTGTSVVTAILLSFVVSITAYKGFWKQVAPNLKEKTSRTPDNSSV